MTPPRMSLATAGLAVLLIAVNLAVLRIVIDPVEGTPLNLILSLMPMANVGAILGYHLVRHAEARRPYAVGFLVCGLAAMLIHTICHMVFPTAMTFAYIEVFRAAVNFCRINKVPGFIGKIPGGGAYFRYYFALAIPFALPQFVAAIVGARMASWLAKGRKPKPVERADEER